MGAKHIALLFVLVAAIAAQEFDSSTYILSRARRSPHPQYQYSQGVASHGGAGRPYYQNHFAPHGYRPNRLNYQFYGHPTGGFQHYQPGNGYYHYNSGNSFGTPSVVRQEVPGTLLWVPLDTLPFHIHLQQELEFLKLHSAIAQAPIIGGGEDAVEIPGQFNTRVHRHGWSSNENNEYSPQPPRRRPCLRRHVPHIWTKEGDIILPERSYEMRSSRNIAITFPSSLYRPPTILREVKHEPTVLHEIKRPAAVTLQEVENEVESDGQHGGH